MRSAAVLLALWIWGGAAAAEENSSAYTDLDISKCRLVDQAKEGEGDWAEWRCEGYRRMAVRVVEDDLRYTVSYGANASRQCAAHQTFNRFNSLGPKLEWRLAEGKPFATILRWREEADGQGSSWLVVSRLAGDEACVIAYVDATLPGANDVARHNADQRAGSFNCAKDPPTIVSKRQVELTDLANGGGCEAQ